MRKTYRYIVTGSIVADSEDSAIDDVYLSLSNVTSISRIDITGEGADVTQRAS